MILIQKNLHLMRKLGENANVEIVPNEALSILRNTLDHEGVIMAGVPGAGGFDAIYAICDLESSLNDIKKLWIAAGVKILHCEFWSDNTLIR